ncbi:MAG TPA: hypothetical protein VGE72_23985 [Azospirillum sp.]
MSATDIIDTCENVWDANKSDCNAFVKAVASRYGVMLTGQANDIVDQIADSAKGWTPLSNGGAAKQKAAEGALVIGGLKGSGMTPPEAHGHVVVVVDGPLAHDAYPTAYWGTLNSVGKKKTTVNWAWKKADRDKVFYAWRNVATS